MISSSPERNYAFGMFSFGRGYLAQAGGISPYALMSDGIKVSFIGCYIFYGATYTRGIFISIVVAVVAPLQPFIAIS